MKGGIVEGNIHVHFTWNTFESGLTHVLVTTESTLQ